MRISDWSSDVCSSDLLKPSTLLRPQTAIKKINRKPNEINGLAGHPYASARSPTVTFDNENKSTPKVTVLLDGTTDGRVALGGEIKPGETVIATPGLRLNDGLLARISVVQADRKSTRLNSSH